jgi:hypothetical protein
MVKRHASDLSSSLAKERVSSGTTLKHEGEILASRPRGFVPEYGIFAEYACCGLRGQIGFIPVLMVGGYARSY